jgi:DNA-binding response OmpR family regulator
MRFLLVEDDLRLARVVRRGLEAEGFVVEIALDGHEGLRRAGEDAFDAILLDVMLPGLNGYAVCAALREAGNWAPVLMLTALDDELDEAEGLDSGADDFLRKPFSFLVLVARLRALVRRGAPERPTQLTVGTLRLDPARHRCWRGETEIQLAPREFAVLHVLARRGGDAVSKRELLEQCWDTAYEGSPNLIEVYIGLLRRKIDDPFRCRSLETVRGVGYRLVEDTP